MNGPPAELRVRLIQAAYEAAVAEGRYEAPQTRRAPSRARLYRDGRLTLLAPHFDYAYYAFENPEFANTGLDELEHYNFFGWPKLRNPTAWFDTGYYLANNEDALASGDNPFWHYIFKGRAEGRAPRRPRGAERAVLDGLEPPEARAGDPPADLPRLSAEAIALRLAPALVEAAGFVYSFGEQGLGELTAEPGGFVALHASPLRGGALFRTMPAPWSETQLVWNGASLGVATDADIAKALAHLRDAMPERRWLDVHGLAGASVDGLIAIDAALEPGERRFHLRDYASLCANRHLLRNDVAACAAPPPESLACFVCIYGEARKTQLQAVEKLFQRLPFAVLAPSQSALALWRRGGSLAHESAQVAAPVRLDDRAEPAGFAEIGALGAEGRPVRVAFVGPRTLAAGWLTFARILETCGELSAYALHHFAHGAELRPSRNLFNVEVAGAPTALRDLLVERRIDLVVTAAEWAEPFCVPAVAALAAGCDLVALRHSGHAAELVETLQRGRLFADGEEAVEFFVGGKALAYACERDRFPRYVADLRLDATAAASTERRA